MSYQVLARKWRPASFDEMMGQQHVLRALVNALDHDRLHHAYLFTGTRGVGKTTVARILAKCLNCERGVSAAPCGECGSCVEIAEGRSVDLMEVDAASRTKVEDTRDLLDNVQYAPTRSRYKIYLIDEVHMLSAHSFNALLKTLEEPPPHAKFLLATTDPQKLPATILSRCLQFNLKNMLPDEIVARLQHILEAEQVAYDEESLQLIARAAEGSMRDALSLTDQAIGFGGGALASAEVRAMLGTVDRSRVLALAESVLEGDPAAALASVADIAAHAPDYAAALSELAAILHQVTVAQMVPDAVDAAWGDQARIAALAATSTVDAVQLCYQMAVTGRSELTKATDPRIGLEMILLRMIAFSPAVIIGDAEAGVTTGKKSDPPVLPVVEAASHAVAIPAAGSSQDSVPVLAESEPLAPLSPAKSDAPPADHTVPSSAASEVVMPAVDQWPRLYERLGLRGLIASVMLHTEWVRTVGQTWYFVLDERQSTLFNERQVPALAAALGATLGQEVSVDIAVGQVGEATPAAARARAAAERLAAAEAALGVDERLQALLQDFEAEVIAGSIRAAAGEEALDSYETH